MINLAKYTGAKVGVFGLGKTGLESIKALLAAGAMVYAWDDDKNKIYTAKNTLQDERVIFSDVIDPFDIKKLDFVIVSPGVPHQLPKPHAIFMYCKKYNIPIKTDINLLFEVCPNATYIGVTGTNGKSTTASLIQHVLASNNYISALGGNIGIPVLNMPHLNESSANYVLELSSYQLELLDMSKARKVETLSSLRAYNSRRGNPSLCKAFSGSPRSLLRSRDDENSELRSCDDEINKFICNDLCHNVKFNIAILLSITPDHLDRYNSFEEYKSTKIEIFQNQQSTDFGIISIDVNKDIYHQLQKNSLQKIIPLSTKVILKDGISTIDNKLYDNYFEYGIFTFDLPRSLIGQHNAENILATYATAKILNLNSQKILQAINSFGGLPHRMEIIGQAKNITFINDSKATNIAATSKVLDCYEDIHWIAGGILKEKEISVLGHHLKNVKHCYLIGRDAKKFISLLEKFNVSYTISESIENALIKIKNTVDNGTVLLAPACASFDQWKNFEARGNAFKKLVNKYFNTSNTV